MKIHPRFFMLLALCAVLVQGLFASTSSFAADGQPVYADLAIDLARGRIYASNTSYDRVDVLSMETRAVVDTIEVGDYPQGLDLRPDGEELVVAKSGELVFINPDDLTITQRVVPAGTNGRNLPYDVRYGPDDRLYVSTDHGIQMVILDGARMYFPQVGCRYCQNFTDTFDNPYSGWPIVSDEVVSTKYIDGEYQVYTGSDRYYYLFTAPGCLNENYSVSTLVHWGKAVGESYGLVFEITGDFDRYYLFDVNTRMGVARLLRVEGEAAALLRYVQRGVLGGQQQNRLSVKRENGYLDLSINDERFGVADTPAVGDTRAGIVVFPHPDPPVADARFDVFTSFTYGRTGVFSSLELDQDLPGPRLRLPQRLGW